MAWVTIDDQTPRNRKMLQAGPAACWLWVCGIAHCQSLLTDGFVADEVLPMIGVLGAARTRRLAEVLVGVGLFERVDGGYRIHDYHTHNATAEEARAQRVRLSEVRAKAGKLGGIRSAIARREANKQTASNASKQTEAPSHPIPVQKEPHTPFRKPPRLRGAAVCPHSPLCRSTSDCIAKCLAERPVTA